MPSPHDVSPVRARSPWSDDPVLELDGVSVRYDTDGTLGDPVVRDVELSLREGEILLVVGRTGCGKSTLLGAMTGAVPHFTGGELSGTVRIAGLDTRNNPPRTLSDVVGVVGQNPLHGFVTDTVEEELAYGMEQLGLPPAVMRKRVEETLDLLGIAHLRDVALTELSGGEQQRVALGAVLTTRPALIVLDEPTSSLDPNGAEDVLATLTRLAHDLAVTVVVAEHRIERVLQYVDRVAAVNADGTVTVGAPSAVMTAATVAPPVVELARVAGWDPLPLSIRAARRAGTGLRRQLYQGLPATAPQRTLPSDAPGLATLTARNVTVDFAELRAVDDIDLELPTGAAVTLIGRNGCGKSTLMWALQGSGRRTAGSVRVAHPLTGTVCDPLELDPATRRRAIGLVPQNAADLLYAPAVGLELQHADADAEAPSGTARAILDSLAPGIADAVHPLDLSEGQRLALVLAIQLAADPHVLLLDEPTRGLDYPAKDTLAEYLRRRCATGHAVLVSTHDVEFAASFSDRTIVMAAGEFVADGPAAEILAGSPAYAPQVAKVTAGINAASPWLTVADVRHGLESRR